MLVDSDTVDRTIRRMASEILERTGGGKKGLGLVGIRRGGKPLAERIAADMFELEGHRVPVGAVDIALYRDDAATALPDPKIGPSQIDFSVAGKDIVLVDDVLQTGRTIRAAIECLLDFGRPGRVWLAVLCDRGGRELPISADIVGMVLQVPDHQVVEILDDDGKWTVTTRGRGRG
ncbi:MAG: bifunctional pyr operon transcriptional regulator/uracil phosphoribosyltransferase PyrR [Myxococcales bacterium]|nr:bifunctional pyr operon transcriptional regulator/uracil phosphoribosyltransferase PyrR [Myxococcales bacterium]